MNAVERAEQLVRATVERFPGRVALACSFGGPSGMALLDLALRVDAELPVYYIDTGLPFDQTHELVERAGRRYGIAPIPLYPELSVEGQTEWYGDALWAWAGESVGIVLDGDRFVGRGDVLAAYGVPARAARGVALEAFWLAAQAPVAGERLRIKRGTQDVSVALESVASVYDIETAREAAAGQTAQYNLVTLTVRADAPLVFDRRADDPHGARMVLLRGDRVVAVGFTTGEVAALPAAAGPVTRGEREARNRHSAAVVWLTGLSGAGKSTLARAAERELFARGALVAVVDGDELRAGLSAGLGFSDADRSENVRRAAAVAGALASTGAIVLVAVIAPFEADRAAARANAGVPFAEVYLSAPFDACERRDPKGLYRRAREGGVAGLSGLESRYEVPARPDLVLDTSRVSLDDAVRTLVAFIDERTGTVQEDRHAATPA